MVRVAMIPGTAQAKLDSKGMKARPDRPGVAHQPVHQEGGADHVAGRFEHQDEQEQDQDLRQEDDHRADPGEQAVDDQRAQQAVGQRVADRVADADRSAASSASAGVALQANTAWNITNRIAARMIGPATGWSSTPSRRWVRRRTGVSLTIARDGDVARAALEGEAGRGSGRRRRGLARGEQQVVELGEQLVDARACAPRRSRSPARRARPKAARRRARARRAWRDRSC